MMNMDEIIELNIKDFDRCNNIWNMEKDRKRTDKIYHELLNKNRKTFIYVKDGEYIAEISVVFNNNDTDYTIPGQRIYIPKVVVKKGLRGNGYGKALMNYIIEYAKKLKYKEISLGVDLDNFIALNLYVKLGFTKIQFIGEDSDGKYVKLIKEL